MTKDEEARLGKELGNYLLDDAGYDPRTVASIGYQLAALHDKHKGYNEVLLKSFRKFLIGCELHDADVDLVIAKLRPLVKETEPN